ncbi:1113_t:CDS:2, partial [Racocetra persica]
FSPAPIRKLKKSTKTKMSCGSPSSFSFSEVKSQSGFYPLAHGYSRPTSSYVGEYTSLGTNKDNYYTLNMVEQEQHAVDKLISSVKQRDPQQEKYVLRFVHE